METSLVEYAFQYGPVATLALIIFVMYVKEKKTDKEERKADSKERLEDRKFMEDRLTKIIEADQVSRQSNTEVVKELVTYLKMRNGSKK